MNYENNTLSKEFTAHLLKPDLYVWNILFWVDSPPWGERGTVDKLVVIIGNSGKAASPRTIKAEVFAVFGGDHLIGTLTLEGPIASRDTKTFKTNIPVVRGGEYRVTVDPQNEIDEEREDNNSSTKRAEHVYLY
jgi:subtilase family serine protease